MPFDRGDALALRRGIRHERSYCGVWLGGCGRELNTRIGTERVPHFAHNPEHLGAAFRCGRTHTDENSADHLYINRALPDWLRKKGRRLGSVSLDGSVPEEGGVCTGVTAEVVDGGLIAVVLRGDSSLGGHEGWVQRDAELRKSSPWVDWLFGERTDLVRHMLDRQGFALKIRCVEEAGDRMVQVGTQTGFAEPRWIDLAECEVTDGGLWTPYIEEARRRGKILTITAGSEYAKSAAELVLSVRELLVRSAASRTTRNWADVITMLQWRDQIDRSLRHEILTRIDEGTADDEPPLSALVVIKDRSRYPAHYVDSLKALGRSVPDNPPGIQAQWAMDVMKLYQRWC